MISAPAPPQTDARAPVQHSVPLRNRAGVPAHHLQAWAASTTPITVAFVEPNRVVAEGLAAMLNGFTDLHAVAAATANLAFLAATRPDVLVLAVGRHSADNIAIVASLKHAIPDTRIVAIDFSRHDESVVDFVRAGVSGFVLRDAGLDELLDTVRAVAAGEAVLPRAMSPLLFSHVRRAGDEPDGHHAVTDACMTPREQVVIELIGEGLANKEIAQRLNIATHTVKTHVRHVMEKLALHTRLQVAAYSHTGQTPHHGNSPTAIGSRRPHLVARTPIARRR